MKKNDEIQKMILKLRIPIHISYISEHILKKDILETKEIIDELVYDEVIIESSYGKGYYVINSEIYRK